MTQRNLLNYRKMQLKKDTIKAVEERRGNNVMLKTGAWSCKELLVEFVKADSVIDFFFQLHQVLSVLMKVARVVRQRW